MSHETSKAIFQAMRETRQIMEKQEKEQQRKPLTDEQKVALCKQFPDSLTFDAITAIEAAHGIKE